jgi:hypothetical protein
VGSGITTISFSDFVEDPNYCPNDVDYTYDVAGYTTVPSFITFDFTSTTNKVYVETGDVQLAKKPWYNVTIYGSKLNSDGTYTTGTLTIPI